MIDYALVLGLVPVYSTTEHQAEETVAADGAVNPVHKFRHRRGAMGVECCVGHKRCATGIPLFRCIFHTI